MAGSHYRTRTLSIEFQKSSTSPKTTITYDGVPVSEAVSSPGAAAAVPVSLSDDDTPVKLKLLGEGTYGEVYGAPSYRFCWEGEEVVLKVQKYNLKGSVASRMKSAEEECDITAVESDVKNQAKEEAELEVRNMQRLHGGPGKETVKQVGNQGFSFLMAKVPGKSLAEILLDKSLTQTQRWKIWLTVADALVMLKAKGLVHGDCNTSNLLLVKDEVTGEYRAHYKKEADGESIPCFIDLATLVNEGEGLETISMSKWYTVYWLADRTDPERIGDADSVPATYYHDLYALVSHFLYFPKIAKLASAEELDLLFEVRRTPSMTAEQFKASIVAQLLVAQKTEICTFISEKRDELIHSPAEDIKATLKAESSFELLADALSDDQLVELRDEALGIVASPSAVAVGIVTSEPAVIGAGAAAAAAAGMAVVAEPEVVGVSAAAGAGVAIESLPVSCEAEILEKQIEGSLKNFLHLASNPDNRFKKEDAQRLENIYHSYLTLFRYYTEAVMPEDARLGKLNLLHEQMASQVIMSRLLAEAYKEYKEHPDRQNDYTKNGRKKYNRLFTRGATFADLCYVTTNEGGRFHKKSLFIIFMRKLKNADWLTPEQKNQFLGDFFKGDAAVQANTAYESDLFDQDGDAVGFFGIRNQGYYARCSMREVAVAFAEGSKMKVQDDAARREAEREAEREARRGVGPVMMRVV